MFIQAEDGIRGIGVTGVQTCALPISPTPMKNKINKMLSSTVLMEGSDHPSSWSVGVAAPEQRNEPGPDRPVAVESKTALRSEERRVGKECRSRWSLYH